MDITSEEFEWLVRNAAMSADTVAIKFRATLTPAQLTRTILSRGIEALEANGIIKIVPVEQWPEYYIPDPPYEVFFSIKKSEWSTNEKENDEED